MQNLKIDYFNKRKRRFVVTLGQKAFTGTWIFDSEDIYIKWDEEEDGNPIDYGADPEDLKLIGNNLLTKIKTK